VLRDASLRDAPQHEDLRERLSLFNCQTACPQTRIIAPCSSRPQGKPSFPVPCLPKERAERLAKEPLSRPPAGQTGSPSTVRKNTATSGGSAQTSEDRLSRTGASEAVFRLRSAHGWICRPAGCPRVKSFRPRSPFVRADARTFTRAVRALCRGLPERFQDLATLKDAQGRQSLRTSASRSTPRDLCGALRIGTGRLR